MRVKNGVPLTQHSTMRLGGKAKHLVEAGDKHELTNAVQWAKEQKLPVKVIGNGSNIIWTDDGFAGLVIVNRISGFKIVPEDEHYSYVTMGAGENWDECVQRTVAAGLHGIEALSLIPGTAGATPIQNVGAYGQDMSQTLVSLEAYDTEHERFVTINAEDCEFGYRTSRFKTKDKNRFLIVELTFLLSRINPRPPYYLAVSQYLHDHKIQVVTPKVLRQVVIAIRTSKLPDPAKVANTGSFFANPIVSISFFKGFIKKHPGAPNWKTQDNKYKISAAWLIEQAGLKDYHDKKTGMATWHLQPLVLVNERAKSTKDLLKFKKFIQQQVEEKFEIKLVQEPETA